MRSDGLDRDARRQLLLTRIAVERVDLLGDLARLRRSASVSRLLRLAVAPTPLAALFSGAASARGAGWVGTAVALWRRWRRVAPVAGLLLPLLRRRRWLRRLLLAGGLAAGVWAARRRPR